jgi:hypothetical protein
MIRHEHGKCYRMKFSDGAEITFRYVGGEPVIWGPNDTPSGGGNPVVEVKGQKQDLHQLMVGRRITFQEEIDCSELDLP